MRNKPTPQLTADALLEQWLKHLAADRSPATVRRYQSAIRRFLGWYETQEHQPLGIQDLTPIALVGYRTALQKTDSTSTVNTHVSALRAWCRWLAEIGCLTEDPAKRLKLVDRQESHSPEPLKASQVQNLLNAASRFRRKERTVAILQVLLQTGMRIAECAALNFEDVEISQKKGQVIVRAGKGNKARIVPLNSSARQALAEYASLILHVEPNMRAVAAAWPRPEPDGPPTPLWQSQKGGRMTASAIQRMMDGLVRACHSRHLLPEETSAHTLRHTFATHYLGSNAGDLVGLASLLGHSSLNTTRIYVQPSAEELAERVEGIDLNAFE